MIYTLKISLLIEKPSYLLRPQTNLFISNSVRVYRHICEIFLTVYVPRVGLLTPCFAPREGFLYTMIVPRGGFLPPSSCVPGWGEGGGMVLDETDSCRTTHLTIETCGRAMNHGKELQKLSKPSFSGIIDRVDFRKG